MVVPWSLRRPLYRRGLSGHQARRRSRHRVSTVAGARPRDHIQGVDPCDRRFARAARLKEIGVMQTKHRLFDDAAKLAGGAIGTLAGVRREIEALARQQLDRLLDGMELVTRDEFEAVKAMAAAARTENERLAARLAALEGTPPSRRGAASKAKAGRRKGASRPTAARTKPARTKASRPRR
jgi:BMFP domain-containing protein YqiC